jgi:hypothetical protein
MLQQQSLPLFRLTPRHTRSCSYSNSLLIIHQLTDKINIKSIDYPNHN